MQVIRGYGQPLPRIDFLLQIKSVNLSWQMHTGPILTITFCRMQRDQVRVDVGIHYLA
jgi:hypothetical protein